MSLALVTVAAPNPLPDDPAGALGALRIRKLEDISYAGVKLATQIRERADAALGGGLADAWEFARVARGVRQTVAMEIRLFGDIDPERTARQMAKLAAVSDAGMALARLIDRLLDEPKLPEPDIAGQFLRIARAARLTIAMEDWVEADSRMPEAHRMAGGRVGPPKPPPSPSVSGSDRRRMNSYRRRRRRMTGRPGLRPRIYTSPMFMPRSAIGRLPRLSARLAGTSGSIAILGCSGIVRRKPPSPRPSPAVRERG
jgi:hypothetical protein